MSGYGISKCDLKNINRIKVLRTIWECGPISRSDIADELRITRAAITVITNEMIEKGLIMEVGSSNAERSTGVCKGRRKVLLELNSNSCFMVGVYIDSHNVSVGMTTLKGDILEKYNFEIEPCIEYEEIIIKLESAVRDILSHNCLEKKNIMGVGVGIMPDMPKFIEKNTDADPEYLRKLQYMLTEKWNVPIHIENALSLFAVICSSKREFSRENSVNVMLYADDDRFYLSYVLKKPRVSDMYGTSTELNHSCIKKGGAVKNELTPKAIGKKVLSVFGEKTTPALYKMTGSSCNAVTLLQVRDAVKMGDSVLEELYSELFDEMCVFLNNTASIISADRIYFYRSDFTEELVEELIEYGKNKYSGLNKVQFYVCNINDEHRFVCGSGYAVYLNVFGLNDKMP